MNKSILLGDLHFGVKGFSKKFFENQISYFKEELIPRMKKDNIKTVFQFGDFFDNRKIQDVLLLTEVVGFLEYWKEQIPDLKIYMLLGNHDIYFREKLDVSTIELVSKIFDFIEVIKKPTCIGNIQLFPWVVGKVGKEDFKRDIIFGHFEIKNFNMTKGIVCESGLETSIFGDRQVYSGHFHLRGERSNIHYIGTPYQINWNDVGDKRGAFIFDTENGKILDFIENKSSKLHIIIIIKDGNIILNVFDGEEAYFNLKEFGKFLEDGFDKILLNSYVKIIVKDASFRDALELIKSYNILEFIFINQAQIDVEIEDIDVDTSTIEETVSETIKTITDDGVNKERLLEKARNLLQRVRSKQDDKKE